MHGLQAKGVTQQCWPATHPTPASPSCSMHRTRGPMKTVDTAAAAAAPRLQHGGQMEGDVTQ
jgi:hypothetical protein